MNKIGTFITALSLAVSAYTLSEVRHGQRETFDLQMKVACLSSGDAQRITAVASTNEGTMCTMDGRRWITWK
jgi:hypothetical protein